MTHLLDSHRGDSGMFGYVNPHGYHFTDISCPFKNSLMLKVEKKSFLIFLFFP